MTEALSLDGIRMRTRSTAPIGAVSVSTLLVFEQAGALVSARYRGGSIADGYLIGHLKGYRLRFRYVQAQPDGRLDAGFSDGVLSRLPDGRLQLQERFTWTTRPGTGTNTFEEIHSNHEGAHTHGRHFR